MTKCIEIPTSPFAGIGKKIESLTRKALYEYELIDSNRVALALSGGKDSLTLLFMLKAISARGFIPFDLHAIHISGQYSCGAGVAEGYLKEICAALEVPLDIIESQQDGPLGCYPCSRERRRLIFTAAKNKGCSLIAFGHHRDDSNETLLLNLLHKGEFAAILPKLPMIDFGITIIRPLIFVAEEMIRTFAEEHQFLRFMCQCPIGATSQRKTVKDLIESLEADFPHVKRNLEVATIHYGSDKALKK